MQPYAGNTRTRRNLEALRAAGWAILVTPDNPYPPVGFSYAVDNGAFGAKGFQAEGFAELADRLGSFADFVVLPDMVAGGAASLELSLSWLPRLRNVPRLLLPIQDGMTAREVGMVLRQNVKLGLFLGGSTEYKLRELYGWGMVAHAWKRRYHVGRVNTARRIRLCAEAGADSFDGTSATMYSSTLPLLDSARRQPSLLRPDATRTDSVGTASEPQDSGEAIKKEK